MSKPKKAGSDRAFGLLFAALFGAIGLWPLLKGGAIRPTLLGVGAIFLVLGLAFPTALSPLNRLWLAFGDLLHRFMTPLLMGLIFFFAFTPIGLLKRLTGHDDLGLKWNPEAPTYWTERSPPGPSPESMKQQF